MAGTRAAPSTDEVAPGRCAWSQLLGDRANAFYLLGSDERLLLWDTGTGADPGSVTDRDELARHAAELRAHGVSTTTFGVGHKRVAATSTTSPPPPPSATTSAARLARRWRSWLATSGWR